MLGNDMRIDDLHDAKRPTFVGLKFDNRSMDEIMKLSRGVDNRTSKDELHVTLIYSRKPILITPSGVLSSPIPVKASHYSIFKSNSGENCLVVEIDAPAIVARHHEIMKKYGASYDFPEYKPHFTLSYNCGVAVDLKSLPPLDSVPTLYCHQEYASDLST